MGLTYSSVVGAEPDEVFAWHSRAGAITRLMPPWQPVRVAREAPSVRDGQAVLALPGGLRWVAGHDPGGYDPPRQFADVLLALQLFEAPGDLLGNRNRTRIGQVAIIQAGTGDDVGD